VLSLIEQGIRDKKVTDLIKHTVTVAFLLCTELSAAQHVFAVPSFLARRRAKNGAAGDARLLEVRISHPTRSAFLISHTRLTLSCVSRVPCPTPPARAPIRCTSHSRTKAGETVRLSRADKKDAWYGSYEK
jgi:hypothetical protein